MRLGTAIERLVDNYRYASDKEWIQDKVAWALYHTWKEADDRKTEPSDSEKPNNCETCKNWDIVNDHCYFIQECRYEPRTTEDVAEELLAIKKILDDGKMPKDEQTDCPWK